MGNWLSQLLLEALAFFLPMPRLLHVFETDLPAQDKIEPTRLNRPTEKLQGATAAPSLSACPAWTSPHPRARLPISGSCEGTVPSAEHHSCLPWITRVVNSPQMPEIPLLYTPGSGGARKLKWESEDKQKTSLLLLATCGLDAKVFQVWTLSKVKLSPMMEKKKNMEMLDFRFPPIHLPGMTLAHLSRSQGSLR